MWIFSSGWSGRSLVEFFFSLMDNLVVCLLSGHFLFSYKRYHVQCQCVKVFLNSLCIISNPILRLFLFLILLVLVWLKNSLLLDWNQQEQYRWVHISFLSSHIPLFVCFNQGCCWTFQLKVTAMFLYLKQTNRVIYCLVCLLL